MKLWHDDVRPPPPGWEWARTNDTAKALLKGGNVEEISLDHDLGYDGPPPGPCGECLGSGLDFSFDEPQPCGPCDGDGFIGGDILYVAGDDDDDGLELVRWMVEEDYLPEKITIHSWNPDGAKDMAATLRDAGVIPLVREFRVSDWY